MWWADLCNITVCILPTYSVNDDLVCDFPLHIILKIFVYLWILKSLQGKRLLASAQNVVHFLLPLQLDFPKEITRYRT